VQVATGSFSPSTYGGIGNKCGARPNLSCFSLRIVSNSIAVIKDDVAQKQDAASIEEEKKTVLCQ
jgi:hypothetical protein